MRFVHWPTWRSHQSAEPPLGVWSRNLFFEKSIRCAARTSQPNTTSHFSRARKAHIPLTTAFHRKGTTRSWVFFNRRVPPADSRRRPERPRILVSADCLVNTLLSATNKSRSGATAKAVRHACPRHGVPRRSLWRCECPPGRRSVNHASASGLQRSARLPSMSLKHNPMWKMK